MWLVGVLSLMILVGVIAWLLSRKRISPKFAGDIDLGSLREAISDVYP